MIALFLLYAFCLVNMQELKRGNLKDYRSLIVYPQSSGGIENFAGRLSNGIIADGSFWYGVVTTVYSVGCPAGRTYSSYKPWPGGFAPARAVGRISLLLCSIVNLVEGVRGIRLGNREPTVS